MAQETQAFIDEVVANGATTRQQLRAAVAALVPEAGDIAQEVETLARLLHAAEITEADPVLAGKVEGGFQKLNALRRQLRELESSARDVHRTFGDLLQWWNEDGGFKAAAADAGYTVS